MRNVVDLLNSSTFDTIKGNTAGPSYVSRHAFVKAEFPWSGFFCGYSVLLSYQKIELESVSIYLNILKGPQVYKFLEQFSGTLSKIMLV